MKISVFPLIALGVVQGYSATLSAQLPVKSVDAHGNVTYSDEPPPGAVSTRVVPVDPNPPEERVQAAKQRAEEIRELADQAAKERRQQEQQLAAKQKQQEQQTAAEPKVIVIENNHSSGYPVYFPPRPVPPVIRPPTGKPPAPSPPVPGAISPPIIRPQ